MPLNARDRPKREWLSLNTWCFWNLCTEESDHAQHFTIPPSTINLKKKSGCALLDFRDDPLFNVANNKIYKYFSTTKEIEKNVDLRQFIFREDVNLPFERWERKFTQKIKKSALSWLFSLVSFGLKLNGKSILQVQKSRMLRQRHWVLKAISPSTEQPLLGSTPDTWTLIPETWQQRNSTLGCPVRQYWQW